MFYKGGGGGGIWIFKIHIFKFSGLNVLCGLGIKGVPPPLCLCCYSFVNLSTPPPAPLLSPSFLPPPSHFFSPATYSPTIQKIIKKEEKVKDYLDIYKIHLEGGGEYPPLPLE